MDAIFANLTDPAWWFSIFFPVAVVAILPRVFRWLVRFFRDSMRGRRARRLRRIKVIRRDPVLITYEMQKATAFFVVFILLSISSLAGLVIVSTSQLGQNSYTFKVLLAVPVLWSEMAWLLKDSFVGEILQYRKKILF